MEILDNSIIESGTAEIDIVETDTVERELTIWSNPSLFDEASQEQKNLLYEQFGAIVFDSIYRTMFYEGFRAITEASGWNFLSQCETTSFLFNTKPPEKLRLIESKIFEFYDGHSGSSYGFTIRMLEVLAKEGIAKFKEHLEQQY